MTTTWILCAAALLALTAGAQGQARPDWLVTPCTTPATVEPRDNGHELVLSNGLIRRVFRTAPNLATVDLTNLMTGASILRGVKPEAIVTLDGRQYEIGGLKGQPDYAYLDPAWLPRMTAAPDAFRFTGYRVGTPAARYPWQPRRGAPNMPWPPKGVSLTLDFQPPDRVAGQHVAVTVSVHYELYEGLPVLAKWVSVANGGASEVVVDHVEGEVLAVNEHEKPRLHLESNYAFAGMDTTTWTTDPDYTSQIDYEYRSPILLVSRDPLGPGAHVGPGERYESFRSYLLVYDSDDRERRGLARRRMYRTIAPQTSENPIYMHVRQSDSASLRAAIDQCAETGFEMVILTFGSGFDIESEDPAYIARIKADVDYGRAKGVEVGGYTLMCASRDVGPANDVISPETGKPGSKFGQSACLASEWADGYFQRVLHFMDATGMTVIETDGPFHGDVCASTTHRHHHSLADSQRAQWEACCRFYADCAKRGIYINTPDWYFLNGSHKTAMGYRETNWSLPRPQQILIGRQNIFDGTLEKTASMGWMFVPLVEYQGGGAAATLEPLSEHLPDYEWHLAQNFGSGVMAAYRGPRLYDTDATKVVVKRWVDFYKGRRALLDSDLIHVKRADGRGLDCLMHINPRLKERALAMVYNPTDHEIAETLTLPLYYTGLTDHAQVRERDGAPAACTLDREYNIQVPVKLAPRAITWLIVE